MSETIPTIPTIPTTPTTPRTRGQPGESFGFNDSVFVADTSPSAIDASFCAGFNDSNVLSPLSPMPRPPLMQPAASPASKTHGVAPFLGDLAQLETMGSPRAPAANKENRPLPSDVWEGDVRTVHIDLSDYPGAKSFGFFLRGWEGTPVWR